MTNTTENDAERVAEELLRRILNGLISHTGDLEIIKQYSGGSLTKYTIRSHVADAPRIMGKGGLRFRAYRFILACIGQKFNKQIQLDNMLDPVVGQPEQFPRYKFNPRWPKEEIEALLQDMCDAIFSFPCGIILVEGAGSAIFQIMHDPRESAAFIEKALPPIQDLMQAIGVTNGCQISIDTGVSNG